MVRIKSADPNDFQFRSNDTASARAQKLELLRQWSIAEIEALIAGGITGTGTLDMDIIVATRAALAAVVAPADKAVRILTEAGREGMFVYSATDLSAKITIDIAQGIYVAPAAHPTGSSGAWVRVVRHSAYELEWFGGGESASGAVNAAAMLAAWNLLKDDGGAIYYPVGSLQFANTVFPRPTSTIAMIAPTVTEMHPSNPVDGTFMWYFDDTGGDVLVEFYNIHINGKITSGAAGQTFCGVYVGGSNNLIMYNCKGRYVDGTAWKLVRAYNAYIELKTWRSGKADGSKFAFHLTGRAADGLTWNDVAWGLACATEQDYSGWLLENGIKARMPMIKVHGAPDGHTQRALQIHRVTDFNCSLWLTQGYSKNGFVHISDADNGGGITQMDACSGATTRSSGRLSLQNQTDVKVMDGSGVILDMVTLDLGTSSSHVVVDALCRPQSAAAGTSDYRQIGLAAPGNPGARIDLTRVFASDDDKTKLIDDRRTASTKKALSPAAAAARPLETTWQGTGASNRAVGDIVPASFGGTGILPPVNLLGVAYDQNSKGTRFCNPYTELSGRRDGAIAADTRIIMNRKPICAEDAAGSSLTCSLKRVQISAEGIAAAYDAANHWELDIYSLGALQQSLILSRGTLTATAGDKYPNKVYGAPTLGYLMDYWAGLTALAATRGTYVGAILRMVGAPPALTDCSATLYFEIGE